MPDLELGQKLSDSAREYANLAISSLKVAGVVDPPTVIAACARMAGTYLFRSFDLKLPNVEPGQAVLSVEADQHSPMLVRTAAGILATLGIALPSSPPATAYNGRTLPIQSFLETQQLLEPLFSPIQSKYSLSPRQAAQAAAIAAALLVHHFAKDFEPNAAFAIAALGFIEGTKTAPNPVTFQSHAA